MVESNNTVGRTNMREPGRARPGQAEPGRGYDLHYRNDRHGRSVIFRLLSGPTCTSPERQGERERLRWDYFQVVMLEVMVVTR